MQLQGQGVAAELQHQVKLHPAMGLLLHQNKRLARSCLLGVTGWPPSKQQPKIKRYAASLKSIPMAVHEEREQCPTAAAPCVSFYLLHPPDRPGADSLQLIGDARKLRS